MRKILLSMLFAFTVLATFAQETPPTGTVQATTSTSYIAPSGQIWGRYGGAGIAAFYTKLVRDKDLKDSLAALNNKFILNSPSTSQAGNIKLKFGQITIDRPDIQNEFAFQVHPGGSMVLASSIGKTEFNSGSNIKISNDGTGENGSLSSNQITFGGNIGSFRAAISGVSSFTNATGAGFNLQNNSVTLTKQGGITRNIAVPNNSEFGNYTLFIPNKTDTIATLSDLAGAGSSTFQSMYDNNQTTMTEEGYYRSYIKPYAIEVWSANTGSPSGRGIYSSMSDYQILVGDSSNYSGNTKISAGGIQLINGKINEGAQNRITIKPSNVGESAGNYLLTLPAKTDTIATLGDVKTLQSGSGTYVKDGKVNLGINFSTIGTTNEGLLTQPTGLIYGDLLTQNFTALSIQDKQAQLYSVTGGNGGGIMSTPDNVRIDWGNGTGIIRTVLDSAGFRVFDSVKQTGIVYDADYTNNALLNDRAVTDVGGIKQLIATSSVVPNIQQVLSKGSDVTAPGTTLQFLDDANTFASLNANGLSAFSYGYSGSLNATGSHFQDTNGAYTEANPSGFTAVDADSKVSLLNSTSLLLSSYSGNSIKLVTPSTINGAYLLTAPAKTGTLATTDDLPTDYIKSNPIVAQNASLSITGGADVGYLNVVDEYGSTMSTGFSGNTMYRAGALYLSRLAIPEQGGVSSTALIRPNLTSSYENPIFDLPATNGGELATVAGVISNAPSTTQSASINIDGNIVVNKNNGASVNEAVTIKNSIAPVSGTPQNSGALALYGEGYKTSAGSGSNAAGAKSLGVRSFVRATSTASPATVNYVTQYNYLGAGWIDAYSAVPSPAGSGLLQTFYGQSIGLSNPLTSSAFTLLPQLGVVGTYTMPSKTSGTIAVADDIPVVKVFETTQGDSNANGTFTFAHGLSFIPTMAQVSANSIDAIYASDIGSSLVSSVVIDGANITIYCIDKTGDLGPNASSTLKWTVLFK